MALAALWVMPVSIAVLLASYKVQDRVQAKTMAVKMTCADGIQEYIETIRDLKASKAEGAYLDGLSEEDTRGGKADDLRRAYERRCSSHLPAWC